ncbi:MAG: ABC-type transport auxiliary lipoprotein family protein [Desulfobacterales bacterium]
MNGIWRIILLVFCGFAVQCSLPFRQPVETTYFKLQYPYREVGCAESIQKGLRIRSFTENIPYNRNEMVVLGTQRDVQLSFKNRWVGRPGEMIAQKLADDFSRDPLFSRVTSSGDLVSVPLEMNGKILQFAWAEENSKAKAVLEVVVVITDRGKDNVLFKETYRYQSPTRHRGDPATFADAMSGLIEQFSIALREDLCAGPAKKN